MANYCEICNKKAYSSRCVQHKVRKPIATASKPLKRTPLALSEKRAKKKQKAIKREGKHYFLWAEYRAKWLKENMLPDLRLPCHYCGKELSSMSVTLDHKLPRSRAPQLRYEASNIVPSCYRCNRLKGSVAHDEYVHVCHILTKVA